MTIFFIILIAILFRLALSPLGFHIDIFSNAGWGEWIYKYGPLNFYENNIWVYSWPTQPPLVSLIYGFDNWLYVFLLQLFRDLGNIIVRYHLAPGHMIWFFEFIKWFDIGKLSSESVFKTGYLITIKFIPIISDALIAIIIYLISNKVRGLKYKLLYPLLYLFSPFSWYLSSLWGQYDQFAFLFLLLAFWVESNNKYGFISPFLIATSIAIKPTGLLLTPLYIYIFIRNKHQFKDYLFGTISVLLLFIISTSVFTDQNVFIFSKDVLYGKIFLKAASRLSANAFNLWRIIQSSSIETQESRILFIPAYIWSYTIYIFLNISVFRKLKAINFRSVFPAMFIISAAAWLFMTNMLDRYFFAAVVSGLIVSIFDKRLLKYWLILSTVFAFNLYNQWWFPDQLNLLKSLLLWQNALVSKILAGVNVFIFLRMWILLWNKPQPSSS